MKTKSLKQSKTVWFNVLSLVLLVLTNVSILVDVLPMSNKTLLIINAIIALLTIVVNGVLRVFFTNKPIGLKVIGTRPDVGPG